MELLSAKERDQSFREVELLAKLKHPNVVEYNENFVVDNVLYIVMAYCDGGDLADKIKEQQKIREGVVGPDCNPADPRGYFPISQVLDWFVQMAMAIKYLHGQRVLHRDLKTSNVFLTTENVVKLGDFGIAKTLDSTLDQASTVVGTPYYMSPEVCESKPYSYASDVWSLGCVLYEMLALRHAFDAPNILTLILKIVQQDFAPVPPHYDKEVTELLCKLLDKDPERRPSMEEIFAMPYIRRHMQGLMASGGSLKVKVINPVARRPQHGSASAVGRRRLHPKNVAARRSSSEKRKLRLSAQSSTSQAAPVAPMQWMPIKPFTEDTNDRDVRDELDLLDASILEESQLSFRLPERSTTPEPLVTEEKLHPTHIGLSHNEEVSEELSTSVSLPVRPQPRLASRDKKSIAWVRGESNCKTGTNGAHSNLNEGGDEDDDDDDSRFHAEAEELMNPNFQSEYSEECIDSLQIYYGSKETKGSSKPDPSVRGVRQPDSFRQRGTGRTRTRDKEADSPWSNPKEPTVPRIADVQDSSDVLELSTLSLDDAGSEAPSLSESSMMRELELDADSDDDDASEDTSLSEYEAEENFYSDDSSDFFDQSGTQYSDDFEDPDAEIIEYADDEFVSEGEDDDAKHPRSPNSRDDEEGVTDLDDFQSTPPPCPPFRPTDDDSIRFARVPKLEGPAEVQWVMRNVAQSLMLTREDLHPRQAA
ncbi:unnamed protein product [Phytophthora lilii]|uniref:non-specific serine/threonine protein kinase n=1 Tax=Phytophthora lilii TaxID=2077276 RepID=A0A9W6WP88_9STRA|nr:unnamed protein product [Phytophthora lilii]